MTRREREIIGTARKVAAARQAAREAMESRTVKTMGAEAERLLCVLDVLFAREPAR